MIERNKIITDVKRIVEKNKLEKSFFPIIEEFFFRLANQDEWTDYDLKVAMGRFERVNNIKFINFWEDKLIYKQKK